GSASSSRLNADGVSGAPAWKPKSCASFGTASFLITIVPQVLSEPSAMSFCSAVTEEEERVSAITVEKQSSPCRSAVRSMPPSTNSDFVYVPGGSCESVDWNGNAASVGSTLNCAHASAPEVVQVPCVSGTSVSSVPLTSPPVPTQR